MASFWSQPSWLLIHTYAFYNEDARRKRRPSIHFSHFKSLFESISHTMPCALCRKHFSAYLKKFPITKATNIFKYTVDLHNDVNRQLNKPVLSLKEAYNKILNYIYKFDNRFGNISVLD